MYLFIYLHMYIIYIYSNNYKEESRSSFNRQTFHCEISFRNESVKVGLLHQLPSDLLKLHHFNRTILKSCRINTS